MEKFRLEQFKKLSGKRGENVISIYVPTHRVSSDGYQKDKTLFKNELQEISGKLRETSNLGIEEARKLLQPAFNLLDNLDFWMRNLDMLAYFIVDGEQEWYRLPIKIDQSSHVIGKRPFVLPLVPELHSDGEFYLLYLDLNKIRLYVGSRNEMKEMELDPKEVALSFAEEEEQEENITTLSGKSMGTRSGDFLFHGHGDGSDEEKKAAVRNYFNRMMNMLEPKLNERPLPLFLAGIDYLIPIFRQACKYSELKEGHIRGTHNGDDIKDLQKKAWKLAADHFSKERETRKKEFGFKQSRNLAIARDHEKLIKTALTGGVDTLLVNANHKHLWGSFNEDSFKVKFDEGPNGDNHCLIDLAASSVIDSGGKVYITLPEDMPDEALIAGTLRYEM